MIHLDRAPKAGREFLTDLSDASIGAELPSALLLPAKFDGHPALAVPYDVVSSSDERFSFSKELPAWGGAVGDDVDNTFLFLNDAIPKEIRPHLAGLFSLAAHGESYRLVRALLDAARKQNLELEQYIGSTLITLANMHEPYFCQAPRDLYDEFESQYGFTVLYHRNNARSLGGETMFMGELSHGISGKIRSDRTLESERLQAEIPFGDNVNAHTRKIGKPYGLRPDERVMGAVVSVEPKSPRKPHVCAGCHLHIVAGSLRATVEVDSQSRFDHHHYHVSCV